MRGIVIFHLILTIIFIVMVMIFDALDDIKHMVYFGIFSIINLILATREDIINKLK